MERTPITLNTVIRVSFFFTLIFAGIAFFSLLLGPASLEPVKTAKALLFGWYEGYEKLAPEERTILFSIRLSRIIFAGLVGASLSTAGVVFQALLRNPLAEPYILGVSGGAAVGAILSIILGLSVISLATPLLAISGAALTVFLVFAIGKSKGRTDSTTLLLAGVIVNAFFSAVIMFLLSLSKSSDLHSIAFWLMGDLGAANKMKIALISSFSFFGTGLVYTYARSLNLIVSGEETALQLGIDVERTKTILIIAASAITGFAVAFSGIIGFVGLIIPHVMRMLFGPDHRLLIPAAFFCGASFLVAADTVARTVLPSVELPVGVITALCGAPYFIFLLKRRSL